MRTPAESPLPEARAAPGPTAREYALLWACSLFFYLAAGGATSLWDRDEPRFAQATREMLETGDYVTPRFAGNRRYDKPVLSYWLMAASCRVWGVTEFGCRFPSAVCASLACVLTAALGARMFGRRAGLAAGLILASSATLVVQARAATADALMLLCLTAALWCFYRALETAGRRHTIGAWVCVGLGVLTKGPVALGFALTAFIAFALLSRRRRALSRTGLPWGWAVVLAVFLPWAVMLFASGNGDFLWESFRAHVWKRAMRPKEGHSGWPGFYLATLPAAFLPWFALLPAALAAHWRNLRGDLRPGFLLAWVIGPLGMFELVSTKLIHYLLPAYPALAILVAAAFVSEPRLIPRFWQSLSRIAVLSLGLLLATALPCAAWVADFRPLLAPALAVAAVAAAAGLGAWWALGAERLRLAVNLCAGGFAAAMFLLAVWALPALEPYRVIKPAAQEARRLAPLPRTVGLYCFEEPSAVFYLEGKVRILREAGDLRAFVEQNPGSVILGNGERLRKDAGAVGVEVRIAAEFNGPNFANPRKPLRLALGQAKLSQVEP